MFLPFGVVAPPISGQARPPPTTTGDIRCFPDSVHSTQKTQICGGSPMPIAAAAPTAESGVLVDERRQRQNC
jgi:hypothetical protein